VLPAQRPSGDRRLLHFGDSFLRTFPYVDGFNLYYRALRNTPYKWLNLRVLIEALLRPENTLEVIRYYTARVSGRTDPGQPKRQHAYLQAQSTVDGVTVHYGTFLSQQITRPLVNSPAGATGYATVWDTEEKGSDVNLASHLLFDGVRGLYDVAVVVSKDTDLLEPIRIVTRELRKPVGLICPDSQLPGGFKGVVSFVRHITERRLASAQFHDVVVARDGTLIHKPPTW